MRLVAGHTLGVLSLVHFPDILPLLLVDDGQDSSDGLSGGVARTVDGSVKSFDSHDWDWLWLRVQLSSVVLLTLFQHLPLIPTRLSSCSFQFFHSPS
jgi:hypothetical protein